MARKAFNEEKTKAGFFQWSLVIIISLVFAVVLALIIMTFAGIDVKDKTTDIANRLPFVSDVVTTENEQVEENEHDKLMEEITSKDSEINQLTVDVADKENTIEQLNNEIAKLNKQIEDLVSTNQNQQEKVDDVSSSFTNMEPAAVGPIISNLSDDLAVMILENMKGEFRGQVLGEMEPEEAARLTNLLLQD
ncbi:MotE family protein [Aquibacillus saliphilus]|uniref:MotE family protein n=1 Tax=Aquibacillus saliphilus TaxID=1909422 RepID=UPI001CEFF941|nr:MotE family protein [Aquibacillus saliphilus]